MIRAVRWDSEAQTWRWSVTDQAGEVHHGTALTREAAEREAEMGGQYRAGEPDRHVFASWRTHRWSRRENRMIPNTPPPRRPRLATPPED